MRENSDDCLHESWECSGRTGLGDVVHKCNDCPLCWTNRAEMFVPCDICDTRSPSKFTTKDSGKREEYDSGMRRDIQDGKPRFDLLLVAGLPYEEQFLTRIAGLLERGATKYGERNWQLANSEQELARFRASGMRHFIQWACGETDEDHAAAVVFNLMAAEYTKWKLENEDPTL